MLLLTVGVALAVAIITVPAPAPARALTIPSPVCSVAGLFSGLAGTLCKGLRAGGAILSKGKGLLSGGSNAVRAVGVAVVLTGIAGWVARGSRTMLNLTSQAIGSTTRPQVQSSWFSASYWRMAAIALLLTIPFLLAACVQAVLRSDLAMIGQAALGYLPLAVLAIMIAAPMTALLLTASDELCTLIATAGGSTPSAALGKLAVGAGATMLSGSTFVAMVVGLLMVAATLTLWVELLIRSAAVYVIVLMLPVLFAALVWPARRVWAMRGVELLVALILSKFAIVAVLSLGASAIAEGTFGGIRVVAGATLVLLAAFAPWAVLRLIPLHELAAGAAAWTPHLRHPVSSALRPAADRAEGAAESAADGPTASGPGGIREAVTMMLAQVGSGGHRAQAETLTAAAGGPVDTVTGDTGRDSVQDGRLHAAGTDPAGPDRAASPDSASAPADPPVPAAPGAAVTTGGEGPPLDDPPTPPQPPEPVHEFNKPSIIFGNDFGFRPPEPGGVAPRPIEDEPTADAEPERVDPPMPPDDEHGTGPL